VFYELKNDCNSGQYPIVATLIRLLFGDKNDIMKEQHMLTTQGLQQNKGRPMN